MTARCDQLGCELPKVCIRKDINKIRCGCTERCTENYRPVCASNRKSYGNKCLMNKEACTNNIYLKITANQLCGMCFLHLCNIAIKIFLHKCPKMVRHTLKILQHIGTLCINESNVLFTLNSKHLKCYKIYFVKDSEHHCFTNSANFH